MTQITRRAGLVLVAALILPNAAQAEEEGLTFGIEAGAQWVFQDDAFWLLSDTLSAGTPFNASPRWGEGYLKPYLTFARTLDSGAKIYGTASIIASGTLGTDVFDETDQSEVLLEEAVVGLAFALEGTGGTLDLSAGAQLYEIGSGMLISAGSGNGFERGALIFGPRQAWEMTGIATWSDETSSLTAFYLDPRELQSADTDTTMAGVIATHSYGDAFEAGVSGGLVLTSEAFWIEAAPDGVGIPSLIPDGRDGMRFVNLWANWTPNDQIEISADLAYETNPDQDMQAWGGRFVGSYLFDGLPFQPRVGYSVASFSGDDPDTPELERFDPLFYDGSPSGWGSGANASLVFLNSNITAHQLFVETTLSERDFLSFRYFHVRANELLSPLQFGQGTRLDVNGTLNLISGVTDPALADDFYVEYTRILNPSTYLTAGASVSYPGAGIVDIRGGQSDIWTGGYVNVVVRF